MGHFWQQTSTQRLVNGLTKPSLDCMVGLDISIQSSILSFIWGQHLYHNLRALSTFPSSLLIFSHTVISPKNILAYLIMSWHLLKNRWSTQTNILSLLPKCLKPKSKFLSKAHSALCDLLPTHFLISFNFLYSYSWLHQHWFIHILSSCHHLLLLGLCTYYYVFFLEHVYLNIGLILQG